MSTEPRYAVEYDFGGAVVRHTIDLPDAEHIHVTRHPDGTVTAKAMCQFARASGDLHEEPSVVRKGAALWVDVEGGAA